MHRYTLAQFQPPRDRSGSLVKDVLGKPARLMKLPLHTRVERGPPKVPEYVSSDSARSSTSAPIKHEALKKFSLLHLLPCLQREAECSKYVFAVTSKAAGNVYSAGRWHRNSVLYIKSECHLLAVSMRSELVYKRRISKELDKAENFAM